MVRIPTDEYAQGGRGTGDWTYAPYKKKDSWEKNEGGWDAD